MLEFARAGCEGRRVRPRGAGLLLVACLHGVAVAGPPAGQATGPATRDPNAAVVATPSAAAASPAGAADQAGEASPWLDQAPAQVLSGRPVALGREHRLATGLSLAGVYAGFLGWAYLAWYRDHPEKNDPQSLGDIWECAARPSTAGCDGWFGVRTYAGGADKLGHAWATMVLGRAGTSLLAAGGWNRTHAALLSAALSEGLFLAVELKDYYYYEFSPGDFTMNTLGALAGVALDLSPRLDELLDFRVEYLPSRQYRYNLTNPDSPCAKRTRGQPSCSRWNVAEDYSGETFLLALHLGAIRPLRAWAYGGWSRYVDLSLGFRSRNYKPPPTLLMDERAEVERTQELFLGVSFNAQGLIDRLLPARSRARKVAHGVLEVLTPPLTLPVVGAERGTTMPGSGGA